MKTHGKILFNVYFFLEILFSEEYFSAMFDIYKEINNTNISLLLMKIKCKL